MKGEIHDTRTPKGNRRPCLSRSRRSSSPATLAAARRPPATGAPVRSRSRRRAACSRPRRPARLAGLTADTAAGAAGPLFARAGRPDRAAPTPSSEVLLLNDQLCLFTLLYAPREQHERILADFVTPIARDLRGAPELHSLFFARYNVPSWQVRFRVLGRARVDRRAGPRAGRARTSSRSRPRAPSRGSSSPSTTARLERYGGEEGMALAEKLFLHDSLAVPRPDGGRAPGAARQDAARVVDADDRGAARPAPLRPRAAPRLLRLRLPVDARDGDLEGGRAGDGREASTRR